MQTASSKKTCYKILEDLLCVEWDIIIIIIIIFLFF